MKKSILSFMMTVFLVCFFSPINASARAEVSAKHGSDFADGELAERLETVFYNGISNCVTPALPAVGDSFDKNTWYTITFANQGKSKSDQSCQAYARAAYSYLFGYDLADSKFRIEFTEARGRNLLGYEEFLRYGVRCGAYLRTTNQPSGKYVGTGNDPGHSLIILGFDPVGVTTLEGNYKGDGRIGICYYTWREFNDSLLAGESRYVCSFSQPIEEIYVAMGSFVNNLGEIADGLVEKTCYDLGLSASNWCGYFVGYCINNSSVASATGEDIPNSYSKNPMTLINWICARKQVGTYYSFSQTHYNRVVNAYDGLLIISTNVGGFTPMPGDIIVYDWNRRGDNNATFSHAGIVTDYDMYSSKVTSVEGNTKTGNYTYVKKITHDKNNQYIIGYIRLNADEKCVITFDSNGGYVYPLTKTVTKGGALDSLPIPTRSGHTFTHWSTAKEGGGAALLTNNYKWLSFNQDTVLYAMWQSDCVSHTYDAERCMYCGDVVGYDNLFDASAAGTYQIIGDTAYIRTGPYQVKDCIGVAYDGAIMEIVGSVINSYGNVWLKTTDGYYVHADKLTRYNAASGTGKEAEAVMSALAISGLSVTVMDGAIQASAVVTSNYNLADFSFSNGAAGGGFGWVEKNTKTFEYTYKESYKNLDYAGAGIYTFWLNCTDISGNSVTATYDYYLPSP